jgi:glycogen operon protein
VAVADARRRQAKLLLALLLLANGTPMLRAGDEFLQTQHGNNNPYNQDNAIAWLDWSRLDAHRDVFRFFSRMIAFRKAHPSLGRSRFWRDDVRWYGPAGAVDLSPESRALAFALSGASQGDDDIYVAINADTQPRRFTLQQGGPGAWARVVDTSLPSPADIAEAGDEVPLPTLEYPLAPHAVAVFLRRR